MTFTFCDIKLFRVLKVAFCHCLFAVVLNICLYHRWLGDDNNDDAIDALF